MSLSLIDVAVKLSSLLDAMPMSDTVPSIWMERLKAHFGQDPTNLPIVEIEYPHYQHPCVEVAIKHYLTETACKFELLGVGLSNYRTSLAELLDIARSYDLATAGPVKYLSVAVDGDSTLSCVERGLFLFSTSENPLAIGLFRHRDTISIEVMANKKSAAEEFVGRLRILVDQLSVYKGQIISLADELKFTIRFHKLNALPDDSLILPVDVLQKIERHTIDYVKHKDIIMSAGLPIKRGILLHGLPGTGKTLTVRYLLTRLGERTTILVHGYRLRDIDKVCELARTLQPSTVVIEDVDLVAEDRRHSRSNPALVELLNEMDGLANDCDVLFLLTTNRAEVMEPALKSRPGRIDKAIEVPLPDGDCRKRLFELYTKGIPTQMKDLPKFIERTDGASPAFMRELVRRAAMCAFLEGTDTLLKDRHLEAALKELLVDGGTLTKSLVGFHSKPAQ